MASASFGDGNRGFQAHTIHGSVSTTFNLHPDRPETPPRPSAAIPFPRDADFVERGTILEEVHRRCVVAGSWAALVGLGGVGKSQLAIEYAYQTRDRSAETWVLWVHASNAARFEQSYRDVADRVKISGRKDPRANIFKLVHDWLCSSKDRWLLVLDNVDDARFLVEVPVAQRDEAANPGSAPKPLRSYIPHSERGSVLVTTRNQDAALQLVERRDIISVQPMDEVQASALFKKKLDGDGDPASIDKLAAALEYMPLAIVQAAAYIVQKAPRCSVRQYLADFRRSDRKRTTLLDSEAGQLRRDYEAKNSVIITWQISFDHIREIRPSAAGLLSLMSFFDRQGIPEDLLRGRAAQADTRGQQQQEANDPHSGEDGDTTSQSSEANEGFEEDVVILRNFCFISVETGGTSFEMHALVQLAMRKWLESYENLNLWQKESLKCMAAVFPNGKFETWERCKLLLPHAAKVLDYDFDEKAAMKNRARIATNVAWYLLNTGNFLASENISRNAIAIWKSLYGSEHQETLTCFSQLGSILTRRGHFEEAKALHQQALKGREKMLGSEHPDTLMSRSYVGSVSERQGMLDEAERIHEQVFRAREKVFGLRNKVTLVSASLLAQVYARKEKYEEAEAMHQQILEGRSEVHGPYHPLTLESAGFLAHVLQQQGKYELALEMSRRALEGREKALGKEHPDTLNSVYNLAYLLGHLRRYDEALLLYQKASSGYIKSLGSDHPTTRACLGDQAALQHQLDAEAVDGARQEVTEASSHPSPRPNSHRDPCLSPRILNASYSKQEPIQKDPWWRKFKKKSGKR